MLYMCKGEPNRWQTENVQHLKIIRPGSNIAACAPYCEESVDIVVKWHQVAPAAVPFLNKIEKKSSTKCMHLPPRSPESNSVHSFIDFNGF